MSLDYLKILIREMTQAQTRHLGIKRKPRLQQLKELVKDPPTHVVRFTNVERANFNPQGQHEEGYGAYVFPLNKYFFEQLMESQIYFSDYKFIHLFKMPSNILDLTKNNKKITIKFVKQLLLSLNVPAVNAINALTDFREYAQSYPTNHAFYQTLKDYGYTDAKTSNALRKLGINGFYDPGENIIYGVSDGEGSQAIITNPASLEFIETMKTDDVLRSEKIIKGFVDSSEEYRNKLLSKTEIPNPKALDKFSYLANSDRPGDISYNNVIKILDYVTNNLDKIEQDITPSKFGVTTDLESGMQKYSNAKSDKDIVRLLFNVLFILEMKVKFTTGSEEPEADRYIRNKFTDEQFENIFNKLSEIEPLIQDKKETYLKFKHNFESLKRFKKMKDRERSLVK